MHRIIGERIGGRRVDMFKFPNTSTKISRASCETIAKRVKSNRNYRIFVSMQGHGSLFESTIPKSHSAILRPREKQLRIRRKCNGENKVFVARVRSSGGRRLEIPDFD